MKSASKYWEERFGEKPKSDNDKLMCAMMREYAEYYQKEQCSKPIVGSSKSFKMTNEQLQQDLKFLAERQLKAGSVSFIGQRETGVSSNSIVAIAYGLTPLEKQELPSDVSDMQSCENMWKKLPKHRKIGDGLKAMEAARNCDYRGKR